ncbi:MAG: cupredoxin domain-containing protein [Chloroflexi bacterium]|nr:cupredoxin domain-containing protein [Chloroflexota bacterium]
MNSRRLEGKVGFGVAIVVGMVLVLSACSGGSGSSANPAPQTKTSVPAAQRAASAPSGAVTGGEIKVTLRENKFPEEIRVKVGAKVVFVITNLGNESHTFEAPDLGLYKEIQPEQTSRIEWTVPDKKGSWDVGCFLTAPAGAHDGMEGQLIIE